MKASNPQKRTNQLLVLVMFALGLWAYTKLPDEVASHWNAQGEADGYYSKLWGSLTFPLITAFVYLLYELIPRIAINKANLKAFEQNFDRFFSAVFIFMIYMFSMTIWWNVLGEFNFNRALAVGIAYVIWESSILITNAKQNWFVGIRTPWTLSNKLVWDATHAFGGKLFKWSAIITLLGVVWPTFGIWFILTPIMIAAFGSVGYSYLKYREVTN